MLWLWILLGVPGVLITAIYMYYQYKFRYWKDRNILYVEPSFPFGNMKGSSTEKSIGVVFKEIYQQTKNLPYVGTWAFYRPNLVVQDPELIKTIFVKDFNHFQDRGIYYNKEQDPLAAHLFVIGGSEWRNLRVKLTPTFTSGKMKMMFQTLVDASDELKVFLEEPARNKQNIEIKDILARFTTDIISSCAFGIQSNSLKYPNSEFRKMGKRFFDMTRWESFQQLLSFFAPDFAKVFKARLIQKEVQDFFINSFKETVEYRQKNNVERKDFLQLLIQLMNKGYVDDVDSSKYEQAAKHEDEHTFSMTEAAAQAFVFFIAGYETSSTAMQFAFYELALNPELQDKLRDEINNVLSKHDGKITYESLNEMEYLDRVIAESMRKYPPVPVLNRECSQTYQIPGTKHIIEKGTMIQIPVYGIQTDPQYFPDPERFDPDRFLPEVKATRHSYTYLPFGEGPRNCIGNRFGLMQSKVGLITILSSYKVEVCQDTMIPIKFEPTSFVLSPHGNINLRIVEASL